jgi:hypothetical protein
MTRLPAPSKMARRPKHVLAAYPDHLRFGEQEISERDGDGIDG